MADRRQQIILLLSSRFDYTHEPINFTAKVVRRGATRAKAGGSPSHWQPCDPCGATGNVTRFRKEQPCDRCKGIGKVRVDDYTNEVVVTDEQRDVSLGELIRRDTQHVRCPDCQDLHGVATGVVHGRQCRRCKGSGQAPVAGSWLRAPSDGSERASGDQLDALLHAIERRDKLGSYHQLDLALAGVTHHVNKPLRFAALAANAAHALRLLDELYLPPTTKTEDGLTQFEWSLVELALAYIDERMPDPILVPRDVTLNERQRQQALKGGALNGLGRERRDKLIRRWDREGKPRQWIAQQTGLSDRQLREIINGKGVAA